MKALTKGGTIKKIGRKALSPAKKKKSVNIAVRKCQQKTMTLFNIRFHNENDKGILEWLERQDNKAGSVKDLIREQIKREGN